MRKVTSLASLLKTADEIIGGVSAAPAKESSIDKLASALEAVTEPVELQAPGQPDCVEMDKLAEAVNILDTAAEIEVLKRMEMFEDKAKTEGYSQDEIGEAIQKVAAARMKNTLPVLVALGFGAAGSKKPSKFIDRLQSFTRQPAISNARTQGY